MQNFRMPGYPVHEYPESDNEKLNQLFIYLFKFKNSPQFLDKLIDYLGWDIDDMSKLKVKMLLDNCPDIEKRKFGSSSQNTYKITDEAVLGVSKYQSYSEWLANKNH